MYVLYYPMRDTQYLFPITAYIALVCIEIAQIRLKAYERVGDASEIRVLIADVARGTGNGTAW